MSNKPLYKVKIHEGAARMLYEHIRFLANVSIPASKRLRDKIGDAIDSLKYNPERCVIYELVKARTYCRRLIVGRYAIIFSIDEKTHTVLIKYILDTRRDN